MRLAQPLFFLLLLMFAALCSHGQVRDSSIVWIDDKVMIVSSAFPNVLNMKTIQGFQTKKGSKYVTVLLMVPDSTKVYNIKIEATGAVPPPVFVTEKVDGERATFTGTWTRGVTTAPGWYGVPSPTIAYSNSVGASVSYTFTGTKVELWGERRTTHGNGTVSIDNGPAQPVSFIGPSALPVLIYSSPDLPLGVHTIRLNVVSGYCLLDYFQIVKPQ